MSAQNQYSGFGQGVLLTNMESSHQIEDLGFAGQKQGTKSNKNLPVDNKSTEDQSRLLSKQLSKRPNTVGMQRGATLNRTNSTRSRFQDYTQQEKHSKGKLIKFLDYLFQLKQKNLPNEAFALEVEQFFILDRGRKEKLVESLRSQLEVEQRKGTNIKQKYMKGIMKGESRRFKRNQFIEEFERSIMEVSEDLIQRKTKSSVENSKSYKVDIEKVQEGHLRSIGEEFFKASDKRNVLELFSNSDIAKRMIKKHIEQKRNGGVNDGLLQAANDMTDTSSVILPRSITGSHGTF